MFDQFYPMGLAFYGVAVPAVLITGLSKGGFGGGIAMLGTPLIALMVAPVQAAAIMLPVLLIMDAFGIYNYRRSVKWSLVRSIVPAGLVGIFIGWLFASQFSDAGIRLLVGVIGITFAVNQIIKDMIKREASKENWILASFWGTIAGFTSFVAHAGGPPFQAYAVPLKLDKIIFAGSGVFTFAILNAVKVLPYFMLGEFTTQNLSTSIGLMPVALVGVLIGVWIVQQVSQKLFYNITYVSMLLVGSKLIWDGRSALAGWI